MKVNTVIRGDAIEVAKTLPAGCVQTVITSPPYWGHRSYLDEDAPDKDLEIGQEKTLDEYLDVMVDVFRAVRRILRDDGTVWLNVGDSYSTRGGSSIRKGRAGLGDQERTRRGQPAGFRHKDRVGVPYRLVFALQEDGWYWRDEIIWHKAACMPMSFTDRTTPTHEPLFLLTKNPTYFYDDVPIRTPPHPTDPEQPGGNCRSVWTIASSPSKEKHVAPFPPKLVERCVLAGTSEKGCCPKCLAPWTRRVERIPVFRKRPNAHVKYDDESSQSGRSSQPDQTKAGVLVKTLGWDPGCKCEVQVGLKRLVPAPAPCLVYDPFIGSGTVGLVARKLGRCYLGSELNPKYAGRAETRVNSARTGLGLGL